MRERRKLTSHGRNLETGDTRTDGHTRLRRKSRPKYCTKSGLMGSEKFRQRVNHRRMSKPISWTFSEWVWQAVSISRRGKIFVIVRQVASCQGGGWDRAVQIINEPGGLLWLLCRILSSPSPPLPPFQFIGLHLRAVPWKLPSLCDWNLRRPWRLKKVEIVSAAKARMCSYLKKGFWERDCVGDGGGQKKPTRKHLTSIFHHFGICRD